MIDGLNNKGWKDIIKSYKKKKISVRILFKYPNLPNPMIRSGRIITASDFNFSIDDRISGLAYYAYDYIIEVGEVKA